MKVGDLIKVNLPNAATTLLPARLRHGQLGVLIEEPISVTRQWKVFVAGKVYWLYPDYFEVQE
jgi:hypothetical protein